MELNILVVLTNYKFPSYEISTRREDRMLEGLQILLSGGLIYGLCHIATVIGKCYIAHVSKNLNNSKVQSLSEMISKDININLHQ